MNTPIQNRRFILAATSAVALLLAGWSTQLYADNGSIVLSGDQEVPPVKTEASGSGSILIAPNKTVSGSIKTVGVAATMAHIHSGARGQNGPVVIPLTKTGDNVWSVPEGAKLPDAAYKDFEVGKLYVNVHSAAYPGGEIRGQLEAPPSAKDESNAAPSTASTGGGY